MKRILCILSSLDAGGAETFVMKLSRVLNEQGIQIDFIVSRENGCYTQEVLDRGGRIFYVPPRTEQFVQSFLDVLRIVKENRYQYMIKLGDNPIQGLDLLAAMLGGAKVRAFRSCNALTGLSSKARLVNAVMRPVLNAVANVKIAPSMLAAEFTFGPACAHKEVHILHNGVDLSVYRYDEADRQRVRAEFGLGDRLLVGHVGRFHDQKNHRKLLEVFRAIRHRRPDAMLMLVGAGEREGAIRDWVKELDLETSVIFTGVRFDVPCLLSAMDVFVFPSLHEGMPNTVIEAQATGLPCVIADTITREANITGLVGYLPLEAEQDVWAETALRAIAEARQDTREAFVAQGYDIQSVAETFVKLLFGA